MRILECVKQIQDLIEKEVGEKVYVSVMIEAESTENGTLSCDITAHVPDGVIHARSLEELIRNVETQYCDCMEINPEVKP